MRAVSYRVLLEYKFKSLYNDSECDNMEKIRIVFMGTPDFSVPVLEGLIENYEVVGVVTQPDKEVGRKKELSFSPVKKVALEHHIPVLQPLKIRLDYDAILALEPSLIVTCAYGQIIPKALLDYPKYHCVNVHASLLPKLRGGAPIHHAIIDGYKETGVTIMYMAEQMDAGNIIAQEKTSITEEDTVGTLHDRLSIIGRNLLLATLPSIINETALSIPQDESEVTFGYNIKREEEWVTFNRTNRAVFNHIRGLNPHPGAYALLDGAVVKLYDVSQTAHPASGTPGQIVAVAPEGIEVATQDGTLLIHTVQFAGKKKMTVKDYLNGSNKEALLHKIFNQE